jgi:hypothetical protein
MFLTGLWAAIQTMATSIGGLVTAFMGIIVATTVLETVVNKVEEWAGWRTPKGTGGGMINGDEIDWDNYNGEYGDTDEVLDAMEEELMEEAEWEEDEDESEEDD